MADQEKKAEAGQELATEEYDLTNVRRLRPITQPRREPPPSDAELAEYRRLRPLLIQMLEEWAVMRSSSGCPVMRLTLGLDD